MTSVSHYVVPHEKSALLPRRTFVKIFGPLVNLGDSLRAGKPFTICHYLVFFGRKKSRQITMFHAC